MSDTPKLKRVVRFDNIAVDETYYTKEGFLIDHPIVTTVGIFEYMNPDGSTRRELRLPEEVFNPDSLASYEGKPIIITHNAGEITKENVEEKIIGTILTVLLLTKRRESGTDTLTTQSSATLRLTIWH